MKSISSIVDASLEAVNNMNTYVSNAPLESPLNKLMLTPKRSYDKVSNNDNYDKREEKRNKFDNQENNLILKQFENIMDNKFKLWGEKILDNMKSIVNDKFKELKNEITEVKNENMQLKKIIINHQTSIEQLMVSKNQQNIIMRGLPCDKFDSDKNKIEDEVYIANVLKICDPEIRIDDFELIKSFDPFEDEHGQKKVTHGAKIRLNSAEKKRKLMNGKSELKKMTHDTFIPKIFIHDDQPYYSRKENDRLRKHKKDIISKNSSAEPYIKAGKLYSKDEKNVYVIVDTFNIENQLFNPQNF